MEIAARIVEGLVVLAIIVTVTVLATAKVEDEPTVMGEDYDDEYNTKEED